MASALASTQWRSEFRRGGQLEKFCYAHTRAAAASYYLFDGDRKADESFSLSLPVLSVMHVLISYIVKRLRRRGEENGGEPPLSSMAVNRDEH